MKLIQHPGEEKLLISKQKALIECNKYFLYEDFLHRKQVMFFLFLSKQGLNLISRSTCFFVLKSYFVLNSRIAKPGRVALSKMRTSIFGFSKGILIINNSQPISFEYNFGHLKYFLQLATKVAVIVLFQIRFFKIQLLVK